MKNMLRTARDFAILGTGMGLYALANKRSEESYQAMRRLFCATNGYSNVWASKILGLFHPPKTFNKVTGILGELTESKLNQITKQLQQEGYYVFENRLSDQLCEALIEFTKSTPAIVHPTDADSYSNPHSTGYFEVYDSTKPKAVRYLYSIKDLIKNHAIQEIIGDETFIAVASKYLEVTPVIDIVGLFWHTSFGKGIADSNAAQLYHPDMDRLRFLQFFIYLTDVNDENGPHCFVKKSHIPGTLPTQILKKGSLRYTDEDVRPHYPQSDFIRFTGPRGLILAEDTIGLHKGAPVVKGHRLLMDITFAVSLFGKDTPKTKLERSDIVSNKLRSSIEKYPRVFSSFL